MDEKRMSLARGQGLPEPLLLEDPMEALAPTAQRLLAAAQRLLASGGFEALKLSAIAREAGESKASIGYHFGNKAGLVTALVDSFAHDANRGLIEDTGELPKGEERIHALIDGETRIAADAESYQSFFEVCLTRCAMRTCASASRHSTTGTAIPCCAVWTRPTRPRTSSCGPSPCS